MSQCVSACASGCVCVAGWNMLSVAKDLVYKLRVCDSSNSNLQARSEAYAGYALQKGPTH